MLKKSGKGDDHDAIYQSRTLTEDTIITIMQRCKNLKFVDWSGIESAQWWTTFPRIAHRCAQLPGPVYYRDPREKGSTGLRLLHVHAPGSLVI